MKHTVTKTRREYNQWVADETLEDFALRYSPSGFRKWSPWLLANTALGGISFLALEAIGAVLLLNYGFSNAFWAIILASVLIFIAGFPISYYAARYNIDIDLLTRGAGFGYVGSTVTSLIYASFCFIFFALEAAIMAQALKLYFHLPLQWGYLLCSLIIIPIVFYGVTIINQLHRWTQPVWLLLMLLPFYFVLTQEPKALAFLFNYKGDENGSNQFDGYYFGLAAGVSFSLIAQIGEQVDYLRFMPDKNNSNRVAWWLSLIAAGPGWIILGCLKQLGGALLAALVVMTGLGLADAKEPVRMYLAAYHYVFDNPSTALFVTTVFVIVSQIKINVTNAYAGSLAWSNFFSRVTHYHPGRVVWLVFNIAIALLLMELGVFEALNTVLGLYSNVAVAWIFAVFADLVINKPLKLSPPVVEFKRAHLYDFNPVGFASMLIASIVSILAFSGLFGRYAQAYSWLFAMLLSLTLSPLIAMLTKGKYYIARSNAHFVRSDDLVECGVCEQHYAETDMLFCPFHDKPVCSLCCTLETNCRDQCKPVKESFYYQFLKRLFKQHLSDAVIRRIASFTLLSGSILSIVGLVFWLVYSDFSHHNQGAVLVAVHTHFYTVFFFIAVLICIASWWVVLTNEARLLAETELNEQNKALAQEVKERKQAESALRERESALRRLFEYSADAVLLIKNGYFYDGNIAALKELGLHSKEQLCQFSPATISPEFQPDGHKSTEKATEMMAIAKGQGFHRFEWEHINAEGKPFPVEVSLTPIVIGGEEILYVAWRNIRERKEAEASIHQLAYYDLLTGLPNRRFFKNHLEQGIARAKRETNKFAVLMLDLDRFKAVNDTLGHLAGDELLKRVAERISKQLRETDIVARLGGDEFMIFLENMAHTEDIGRLAEKIVNVLSAPFVLEQCDDVRIGASIGICVYPEHGTSAAILIDHADMALYLAKDNGRGCFAFFTDRLTQLAREKLTIESRLRYAIKNQQLRVFYQPQVDINSGEIVGAEALVRWQDPEKGLVPPDQFIPIAEESGLIFALGEWVLRETCRQGKQWLDQGLAKITLAVNVSPKQFQRSDLISLVEDVLAETKFPAELLELELTEGSLMEKQEESILMLNKLRALGVHLAIDDFGTGYSSLAYLKRFPLDVLKIDRHFIDDIPFDKSDMEIASTIIAIGQTLNFKVLAEGVETAEQLDFLQQKGCDSYQGYYKSRPLDKEAFVAFLE